jgi:pimeloyl-ACP methyl ester carboxylesterase
MVCIAGVRIAIVMMVVSCISVMGCATVPDTGDSTIWKNHFIISDKRGEPENGVFRSDDPCSDATIELIADPVLRAETAQYCQIHRVLASFVLQVERTRATRQEVNPIIFVHGGLNEPGETIERVTSHLGTLCGYKSRAKGRGDEDTLQRAGGPVVCHHDGQVYFPIFLNWHSGFWSSYWDQIYNVRGGERIDSSRWKWLHRLTTPAYVLGDSLRIVATAPASWAYQTYRFFSKFEEDSFTTGDAVWCGKDLDGLHVVCGEPLQLSRGDRLLDNAFFAAKSPIKWLTTPVVDVLGERAWLNMRRRTKEVFWTQQDLDATLTGGLEEALADPVGRGGSGVFARFLTEFQRLICEIEGGRCARKRPGIGEVALVAHSMGTMIADNMIREFDLAYDRIIYMAAASSIREAYASVVPYLLERSAYASPEQLGSQEASLVVEDVEPAAGPEPPRFYNLMLYPVYDAWEDSAHVVPSGSLLEWIDSMYEDPDSDLDRTFGKWANTRKALLIVEQEARPHMVFKVFGAQKGDPYLHGQFDNLPYWQPDCWGEEKVEVRIACALLQ